MPDSRTVTVKTDITGEGQHLAGLRGLEWPRPPGGGGTRRSAASDQRILRTAVPNTPVLRGSPVIYWESRLFCS